MRLEFFDEIDNCTGCDLSNLEINKRNYCRGYGKLLPYFEQVNGCSDDEIYKNKILLLGLNPSYRRFKRISRAFGFGTKHDGMGWLFYKDLVDRSLISDVIVDNIVKCSTLDNKVELKYFEACYKNIFLKELELFKPKKIICLGSNVFKFLESKNLNYKIEKFYHPSYLYSYSKITKDKYFKELSSKIRICE